MIGMAVQHQFLGILDGNQPLVAWNFANQRFGPRGFAGSGRSGDDDILAAADGEAHERLEVAATQQSQKFLFHGIERWRRRLGATKDASSRQLVNAPDPDRRPSNGSA